MKQRVLITGARGMLGRTLVKDLSHCEVIGVGREQVDFMDVRSLDAVWDAFRPHVVINCAAMTSVDACESDQDQAFRANAFLPGNVSRATDRVGAHLIHISTDYVFSGDGASPYCEWDATLPKTIYGLSKHAGEAAVRNHCPDHTIIRIAWLYGSGGPSFFHTISRLGAQSGEPLKVVSDQVGNPTSTTSISNLILTMLDNPIMGTVHASCEGEASWYEFAKTIFRLRCLHRDLLPCATSEYPRPAPRPKNSRLEKRVLRLAGRPPMPQWQDALAQFLKDFSDG